MNTYTVCNAAILPSVIRYLRREGFRAHGELDFSDPRTRNTPPVDVLCTDASPAIIGLIAGHGLWAEFLHHGLPV